MRRAPAWIVVVGVLAGLAGSQARATAAEGFWVSIAAGAASTAAPADYSEFWFESPHAPPVAINQFSGPPAQATTGGGSTIFTAAGTPVLLPTGDGYATITNPDIPSGSGGLPKFSGGTQASGAPQTRAPLGDANLLSVDLGDPAQNGDRVLSVGLTDKDGNPLGNGEVTLPEGGWWVIGLGPGTNGTTTPPPDPDPNGGGGGGGEEPLPIPTDPPPGTGGGGSVTTPEPASLCALGIGGVSAIAWRRLRRK